MLYRKNQIIKEVVWVIFDEIHYMQNMGNNNNNHLNNHLLIIILLKKLINKNYNAK